MFNYERIEHTKVPLPKPAVQGGHPFRNEGNHERLLDYLRQRLLLGKAQRDSDLDRLVRIDKKVSGWQRLSAQDKIRERQQDNEGNPVITKVNLPLAWVHIDDIMTYFAGTFAPNRGMFYHSADPNETEDATQIVAKMNNDAIQSGYYREMLQGLFSLLKYNVGGYFNAWSTEQGPRIVDNGNGQPEVEMQVRWRGNRIWAVDNYNLLRDPSVPPHKLHSDGEFVATAEVKSHYWLQNRAAQGFYYNVEEVLADNEELSTMVYYVNPPAHAQIGTESTSDDGTDWFSILSETSGYVRATGYELTTIWIRINPTRFGLITGNREERAARNRYEIWRFTILNDRKIISADYMNNVHGHLPCYLGVMNDDLMSTAQKSVAEILVPLQDFASHLINTHVEATRARLYGTTIYDPSMVNMDSIPKGEIAARLKVNPAAYGKDVRSFVFHLNSDMDTERTLQDLEAVMGLINQFFPTQSLPSQIASIDRAVDRQVAAVQQGANRRQQKAARLLDSTLFTQLRFSMYFNILQYMDESEEIVDAFTGKTIKIDIAKLRNSNLPYIIGQGLKAIDRMAAASELNNLIFALIQAPKAAEGIDILALIDYWTSMMDIDVNMKQFRLAPPAADAEIPGVDAAGNSIQPATSPEKITTGAIFS